MKKNNVNQADKRAAFTIVELLTVMAVIAILIGLLVPALGLVHDTAQDLQQKAQFHGIKVGLELYKTEFGDYPESNDNDFDNISGDIYSGANKLAEAMVGYDLMGFHSKSEFRADGMGTDLAGQPTLNIYDNTTLDEREPRFIDLEKANAFMLEEIYIDTDAFNSQNYVLCDSYAKRRQASGKKIGMPVLYYRADTKYKIQDLLNYSDESVYDNFDNENILALGLPGDDTYTHPYFTGVEMFELAITNDQINVINNPVPYRAQSFILISAGKDGLYGTADDVFNFDKAK